MSLGLLIKIDIVMDVTFTAVLWDFLLKLLNCQRIVDFDLVRTRTGDSAHITSSLLTSVI